MWSASGPCSTPASRASFVTAANRSEGLCATDATRDDASAPISSRVFGSVNPARPVGVAHRPGAGGLDAEARDDVRALPAQRPHEVPPGEDAAARPRAEERDRLAVKVAGADDPVERVLHHAGDRAGILGRGDEHRVRGADCGAKGQHRLAGIVAAIGIQWRNRPETLERAHLDAARRQRCAGDVEGGPVRRSPLKAPAYEEDSNHRDTISEGSPRSNRWPSNASGSEPLGKSTPPAAPT